MPCGNCTWTVMNVGVYVGVNYHPNHIYNMETLNNAMKTLIVFIYKVLLYCIRLYRIMNLESFFRRLDCISGWSGGWLYLLIRFTSITTPFKMSIWQLVWNKLRCWNTIFSQFSFPPQRYFLNQSWVQVPNGHMMRLAREGLKQIIIHLLFKISSVLFIH